MTGQFEPNTVLRLKDLHFRWPGQAADTLHIPELTVTRGARVFIRGRSGTGKTTLLNLIAGLHTPSEGVVELLGERLDQMTPKKRDQFRADHLGFIFQQFNLMPYLPVSENIALPCRFSRRRLERALARHTTLEAAVRELLAHLELPPERYLHAPSTGLSVGQQQRVAAARALIGNPEIVIADEPTSALDAEARERFIDLLMHECDTHGSTLLFVSHDPSLEPLFGQTIELEQLNQAHVRQEGNPA